MASAQPEADVVATLAANNANCADDLAVVLDDRGRCGAHEHVGQLSRIWPRRARDHAADIPVIDIKVDILGILSACGAEDQAGRLEDKIGHVGFLTGGDGAI